MPGPLPQPNHRHRNAPVIPTTNLPAGGRKDPPPRVPSWISLGKRGRAWWKWAWATPQAAAWTAGHADAVARRAALEDDLQSLAAVDFVLDELLGENADAVRSLIGTLKSLAAGKLAVVREMRELDDRLGLTPKAMAALRWSIVADEEQAPAPLSVVPDRWKKLGA